jgi:hypothetical protein
MGVRSSGCRTQHAICAVGGASGRQQSAASALRYGVCLFRLLRRHQGKSVLLLRRRECSTAGWLNCQKVLSHCLCKGEEVRQRLAQVTGCRCILQA